MALVMVADAIRSEERSLLARAQELGLPMQVLLLSDWHIPVDRRDTAGWRLAAVLMRVRGYFAAWQVSYALEQLGASVLNSSNHISLFGQKVLTDAWLNKAGLPVVPGSFAYSAAAAACIADEFSYPVVLKPNIGGFGRLVHWVDSPRALRNACEHLSAFAPSHHRTFYVQKALAVERDLRVLLLNGQVVGVVEREVEAGEPSNLSRGGRGAPAGCIGTAADIVERLAQELPRGFFGIDVLVDADNRPYVTELNAVCGFTHAARITETDISGALLKAGLATA